MPNNAIEEYRNVLVFDVSRVITSLCEVVDFSLAELPGYWAAHPHKGEQRIAEHQKASGRDVQGRGNSRGPYTQNTEYSHSG
jgi:hypothetical protein